MKPKANKNKVSAYSSDGNDDWRSRGLIVEELGLIVYLQKCFEKGYEKGEESIINKSAAFWGVVSKSFYGSIVVLICNTIYTKITDDNWSHAKWYLLILVCCIIASWICGTVEGKQKESKKLSREAYHKLRDNIVDSVMLEYRNHIATQKEQTS